MFLDLTGPDDLELLKIKLFNGSTENQIAEYSYTDPSGFIRVFHFTKKEFFFKPQKCCKILDI